LITLHLAVLHIKKLFYANLMQKIAGRLNTPQNVKIHQ